MRRIALLLLPLLLTACVEDAATYYVDPGNNNHTLTIQRSQSYFWNDEVTVRVLASRLPDCQRRFDLDAMPADDVEIELLSNGDNLWTLRAGKQLWRVDTQTCGMQPDPKDDPGQLLGTFKPDGDKLVFEPATAPTSGPAAANADAAAAAAAAAAPATDAAAPAAPSASAAPAAAH